MKIFYTFIFIFLIFSKASFANCDYERLGLGSGSEMIKSVYKVEINKDKNNFSLSSSSPKGVSGEIICNDNNFENLKFRFFFVEHKLHLISVIDESSSQVNHLTNLSSFYGNPTSSRVLRNSDGIDDYHWDLKNKDIFLQVVRNNAAVRSNIKIMSKEYVTLIESHKDSQDVLH